MQRAEETSIHLAYVRSQVVLTPPTMWDAVEVNYGDYELLADVLRYQDSLDLLTTEADRRGEL